ncbi:MAG: cytochrome c [Nitrosomonas sp.]|nr:cytochrome c [Nitrosomonas sp.]
MILAAQPALNLAQHDSAVFLALANKLKEQAMQLENLARHNQIESLTETMTQITNTCNACHSLFRKL